MLWLPVGTETVAIDVCYTGSVFPWESVLPGIRMYVRTPLAMLCVYCISVMYVRTYKSTYICTSSMGACCTWYLCELLDMYVLCCVCVGTIGLFGLCVSLFPLWFV